MAKILNSNDLLSTKDITLNWLIKLRWLGLNFEVFIYIIVVYVLEVDIHKIGVLLVFICVILSNILLQFITINRPIGKYLPLILMLDQFLLTALLYFSGGPNNPFTVLYFVHVIMAVIALNGFWIWLMTVTSIIYYGILFFFHLPIQLGHMHTGENLSSVLAPIYDWHLLGMWFALSFSLVATAYFVSKILKVIQQKDSQLKNLYINAEKTARIASLTTLAAGVAHELRTPLSTIALVSKELEQAIKNKIIGNTTIEDLSLIRNEVDRCSLIIDLMNGSIDNSGGLQTEFSIKKINFSLSSFLGKELMQNVELSDNINKIIKNISMSDLIQIILPIIRNGIEANGDNNKKLKVYWLIDEGVSVVIEDNGCGIDPQILGFIENPFFTTKQPGKGLGMGLFLSRVVADRLGVLIEYKNKSNGGLCVIVKLPNSCEFIDG